MTTIQTTAPSSTCSSDDSGREVARHAINSARITSGLTAIVKGNFQRASFSPDPRAIKSAPSKVEEPAPSSSTLAETSSVEVPTAASTPDEPAAKREYPPITEKSLPGILHKHVSNLMKQHPNWSDEELLVVASDWLDRKIEKNPEADKATLWQMLEKIRSKSHIFWNARRGLKPEKKSVPMPKAETRKDEAKDDGQDLEIPDEIVAIPAPATAVSPKPASSATERTAAPQKTEPKPASCAPARPQTAQPPSQKPNFLLKKHLTTPGYVEELVKYFEEEERRKGTEESRQRINACSYVFARIEKDKGLSEAETAELMKQVFALRPKQEPVRQPSLLEKGRIETLMQEFMNEGEAKGWKDDEPLGYAVDKMMPLIRREVPKAERGRARDRVMNVIQTFYAKSVTSPKDLSSLVHECFYGGLKELKLKNTSKGEAATGGFDLSRREVATTPKVVQTKPLTREEQEACAAANKAKRVAQAEKSAEASLDLAQCMVEKKGEAKRRHRAKLAATVNGKRQNGGKGNRRQQEARA